MLPDLAPAPEPASADRKRPQSPSLLLPPSKRLEAVEDAEINSLSFALDSPMSSPQRTCTLSPNFLDDVADELELSPFMHPVSDDTDVSSHSISVPVFSKGDGWSSLDKNGKNSLKPPLSLLEAVQPSCIKSRRASSNLSSPSEAPSSPEATMLQTHSAWQAKLRAALAESDATTRALLSPAMGRDLYCTVRVLARLSPRQIDSLYAPARDLVEKLLTQTRNQVCQDAGIAPAGMWETAFRQLSQHKLDMGCAGADIQCM